MLPIVLVLLVATSALAAPGAYINAVSISDAVLPKHNGRPVSAFWTDQATEIVDGGETSPYMLTVQQIINDLANQNDKYSQALALAEVIAVLDSQSTGIPGDACAAAEMIDAFVWGRRSGNEASIRSAVAKFIQTVSSGIDRIVQLSINPNPLRFATGPRGSCSGGGRTYQFEAAWDAILANAAPSSAKLVNEQYCAAKRLYQGFTSRSNNAAAYITAASLPPINSVFQEAMGLVSSFVSSIPGGNAGSAAAAAKKALARAAQK